MSSRRLELIEFIHLCEIQCLKPDGFNYFLYKWSKGIILRELFKSVRRYTGI